MRSGIIDDGRGSWSDSDDDLRHWMCGGIRESRFFIIIRPAADGIAIIGGRSNSKRGCGDCRSSRGKGGRKVGRPSCFHRDGDRLLGCRIAHVARLKGCYDEFGRSFVKRSGRIGWPG